MTSTSCNTLHLVIFNVRVDRRKTVLFVSGPKCPHAQAASNDHCNPRTPHWNVNTTDMYRPLIQGPRSLKNGYHTEENT